MNNLGIVKNIYKLHLIKDIMSSNFSLWSLNDKDLDKHPRSWICIKGKNIKNIISKIEEDIITNKKTNREQISRLISQKLSCNFVSIKNVLRGKAEFYPIQIILELTTLSKNKGYKRILENSTEYLKVNSASAKPIKASKYLSNNFSKIIGAFCADGSLSVQFVISSKNKNQIEQIKDNFNISSIKISSARKESYLALQINGGNIKKIKYFSSKNTEFHTQAHYVIELTDEHESNVKAFNQWVYNEFEIKPTSFYKRENAWRTVFSNKIFGRYLIKFFQMSPGYKCKTVKEPNIIKNSSLQIRKDFAKGVLMFDGCVTKNKRILFSTLSPFLSESIKDILTKDGLKVGAIKNKRGEYVIYTTSKNKIDKLLNYFEERTKKSDLLKWLDNRNFESNELNYDNDFAGGINILNLIKKIRVCDSNFLMKHLDYSHTTIRQYLLILKSKGLIKLSNHPTKLNETINENTTVFLNLEFHNYLFDMIREKFEKYENFAKFLEINKGTLAAWKVRANRIPIRVLKEMCINLNIPFNKALENIYETDREITEII